MSAQSMSDETRHFARGWKTRKTRSSVIAAILLRAGWIEVESSEHDAIQAIDEAAQAEQQEHASKVARAN